MALLTARDRYRRNKILYKAFGVRMDTTAQVGEAGRHAYALQEAATMRHRAWLHDRSPNLRRQALYWHGVWMTEARLARTWLAT